LQCRAAGAIEVLQELEQSQLASIREVASNALSAMSQVRSKQLLPLAFPSLLAKIRFPTANTVLPAPTVFPMVCSDD